MFIRFQEMLDQDNSWSWCKGFATGFLIGGVIVGVSVGCIVYYNK